MKEHKKLFYNKKFKDHYHKGRLKARDGQKRPACFRCEDLLWITVDSLYSKRARVS